MSKTPKTPQALPEPVVPVPAHLTQLPWSVKGRGKTATYCAALPNGHGAPNMSVALVARSGAVTFVTLTEIREVDNGVARWDFTKDVAAMTPAVRAANRAAKGTSAAAYWQSDAGLKTAERIAERSNTRASESAQAETEQAPPTPQAPTPQAPTPQAPTPQAPDMASTAAAMRSAGFTAAEVMEALQSMAPTPQAPTPHTPRVKPTPRATARAVESSDILTRCDACNRERKGVGTHRGAPELETCPRCSSLDTDTARTRAARHTK
jgi:hypothetical protein